MTVFALPGGKSIRFAKMHANNFPPLLLARAANAGERRLSLALAFSLAFHGAALLALTPIQSPATAASGAGRGIDAVLKSPLAAVSLETSVHAQEEAPAVVVSGAAQSLPRQKKMAVQEAAQASANSAPSARPGANTTAAPALPLVQAYLPAGMLNRQARLLTEVSVDYPPTAGVQEGRVTLRILISEAGAIDDLAVLRSEPKGFFEDAALSAFARAKFAPGEFLEVPVKSQFLVEVDFVPFNRGAASGRGY